jgi:hypothetical protein
MGAFFILTELYYIHIIKRKGAIMKIEFLENCVADKTAFFIGDVADINDKDANFLIKTKRAVLIKEETIDDYVNNGIDSEVRELDIKKEAKKKSK